MHLFWKSAVQWYLSLKQRTFPKGENKNRKDSNKDINKQTQGILITQIVTSKKLNKQMLKQKVNQMYASNISNLNVWRTVGLCEPFWDQLSSSQQFWSPWLEALPFSEVFCGPHSPLAVHEQCPGRLPELDQRDLPHELWQKHHNYFHIPKLPMGLWHTEATMDCLEDIPAQQRKEQRADETSRSRE